MEALDVEGIKRESPARWLGSLQSDIYAERNATRLRYLSRYTSL